MAKLLAVVIVISFISFVESDYYLIMLMKDLRRDEEGPLVTVIRFDLATISLIKKDRPNKNYSIDFQQMLSVSGTPNTSLTTKNWVIQYWSENIGNGRIQQNAVEPTTECDLLKIYTFASHNDQRPSFMFDRSFFKLGQECEVPVYLNNCRVIFHKMITHTALIWSSENETNFDFKILQSADNPGTLILKIEAKKNHNSIHRFGQSGMDIKKCSYEKMKDVPIVVLTFKLRDLREFKTEKLAFSKFGYEPKDIFEDLTKLESAVGDFYPVLCLVEEGAIKVVEKSSTKLKPSTKQQFTMLGLVHGVPVKQFSFATKESMFTTENFELRVECDIKSIHFNVWKLPIANGEFEEKGNFAINVFCNRETQYI